MMSTSRVSERLDYLIAAVPWQQASAMLSEIRRCVFIQEQAVPEELEWDGLDAEASHFLATDDKGRPIGCARVLAGGRLGRMAVLPEWRRHGVGLALLEAAIDECRRQRCAQVTLSAQTHAIGFYQQAGFTVCSDIYGDAGIPHRDMVMQLSN